MAHIENAAVSHNGTAAVRFELRFSQEVESSFRTLRDEAFEVTEGTVTGVRRVKGGEK